MSPIEVDCLLPESNWFSPMSVPISHVGTYPLRRTAAVIEGLFDHHACDSNRTSDSPSPPLGAEDLGANRNLPAFKSDQDQSVMPIPCKSRHHFPAKGAFRHRVPLRGPPDSAACHVSGCDIVRAGELLADALSLLSFARPTSRCDFSPQRSSDPMPLGSFCSATNPRAQPRVTRPRAVLVNPPKWKPPLLGGKGIRPCRPDCPLEGSKPKHALASK